MALALDFPADYRRRVLSEAAPSVRLGECWWLIRSELQCQAVPRLAEHFPSVRRMGAHRLKPPGLSEATACAAKVSIS